MEPEARMTIAAILALFFGGFATGSLLTARQAYRWREAMAVVGVLVKQGSEYRYQYTPKGHIEATAIGPAFKGDPDAHDGIVDDHVRLDYDPRLPEKVRRRSTRGRPESNYQHFLMTASAGSVFAFATLLSVVSFLRAWSDKRDRVNG